MTNMPTGVRAKPLLAYEIAVVKIMRMGISILDSAQICHRQELIVWERNLRKDIEVCFTFNSVQ